VGRPEALCAVNGDPIPWVVRVVGNRLEPRFWSCCVWRVDSQEGGISLWTHSLKLRDGLLLRENEQQHLWLGLTWEVHLSYVASWLLYIQISFLLFL
jgi:hypothetical protein